MKKLTVSALIHSNIDKVWDYFTNPIHIVNWNFANELWYCPKANNDLRVGKVFSYTMSSKDGKMSFDFSGTYTFIEKNILIKYVIASGYNEDGTLQYDIDKGRKVEVIFKQEDNHVIITENFDSEDENNIELQISGWQSILDNFKKYVEKS